MNDNYEYSFQERVVRLSIVAAIIVGIVCILTIEIYLKMFI